MRIEQSCWSQGPGWTGTLGGSLSGTAQLVMLFGARTLLQRPPLLEEIHRAYPAARILGCSTAGEICDTRVTDDTLVVTAIEFSDTRLQIAQAFIGDPGESYDVGKRLATALPPPELTHVFVLSNGLRVNGSDLVRGLTESLPASVSVTGGLSGDGARFEETLVLWDDIPRPDGVAALGLYGNRLRVGFGSLGGWDAFGPLRTVTRAKGNVLHQLDGQPALALYKTYLGEHAKGLPATALRFPLALTPRGSERPVVRTVLAVNENDGSLTFAGDVPEGAVAQLMKANFDRLIDGAAGAAATSKDAIGLPAPDLAILISCVGRKLVLQQRIEEEVEAVREILGERPALAGFYSYGEIAPFAPEAKCELHNQTMTITVFAER